MKSIVKEIQNHLKANAAPDAVEAAQKFVPGVTKVYGVRMPVLNQLATQYKAHGFELAEALWQHGWYEEKIMAGKILERMAKKDAAQALALVKTFSTSIDNWAVCDCLGMQSLKTIVRTHEKEIFALAKQLNRSANFWQRRLSLVLVEWYTRYPEKHTGIMKLVTPLKKDPEYYVQKAITWIEKNFRKGK
jgi:3-methyladenine DNA glycosylase AlkD